MKIRDLTSVMCSTDVRIYHENKPVYKPFFIYDFEGNAKSIPEHLLDKRVESIYAYESTVEIYISTS